MIRRKRVRVELGLARMRLWALRYMIEQLTHMLQKREYRLAREYIESEAMKALLSDIEAEKAPDWYRALEE